MITVRMTESEYKAYQLFLKSIEIFRKTDQSDASITDLDKYLSDPENMEEIEAGLEDIKAGRVSIIDPHHIWEGIK